jgi:hypothetical protein
MKKSSIRGASTFRLMAGTLLAFVLGTCASGPGHTQLSVRGLRNPAYCKPSPRSPSGNCTEQPHQGSKVVVRTANLNGRGVDEFRQALCVLASDSPGSLGVIGLQEVNEKLHAQFSVAAGEFSNAARFISPVGSGDLAFIVDRPWLVVEATAFGYPPIIPGSCWPSGANHPGCTEGGILEVLIEHQATKSRVRIYNIHNWYRRDRDHGYRRNYLLRKALETIGARIGPTELPPIILGDFNNLTSAVAEQECLDECRGRTPPENCAGKCWDNEFDRDARALLHGAFFLAGASDADVPHQTPSKCVRASGRRVFIDQVWLGRPSFTKDGPTYVVHQVHGEPGNVPDAASGFIDLNRHCPSDDLNTKGRDEHACVTDHQAVGYTIGWKCDERRTLCGDSKCYNLAADPKHCGSCNAAPCPLGKVCLGTCKCPVDTKECQTGKCTPLGTEDDCTACGDACRPPSICTKSGCVHAPAECKQRCKNEDSECVKQCEEPGARHGCNRDCKKAYDACNARCGTR